MMLVTFEIIPVLFGLISMPHITYGNYETEDTIILEGNNIRIILILKSSTNLPGLN